MPHSPVNPVTARSLPKRRGATPRKLLFGGDGENKLNAMNTPNQQRRRQQPLFNKVFDKPRKDHPKMMEHCRPTTTPVRFKKRHNSRVKATGEGRASVKQLSEWLADDPTSTKEMRGTVRRGVNVIRKSRMFEKELENVIVEEAGLVAGDISDKKHWLESAFEQNNSENGSDFDRSSAVTELVSVKDKKKWLSKAFENEDGDIEAAGRASRSCVSVGDKRAWLQSAFQKGSERMLEQKTSNATKTDSSSVAKQKWRRRSTQNRSPRKTMSTLSPIMSSDRRRPIIRDTPVSSPLPPPTTTRMTEMPVIRNDANTFVPNAVDAPTSIPQAPAIQTHAHKMIDARSIPQAPTVRGDTFALTAIDPVTMPQVSAVRMSIPQVPTVRDDTFAHKAIDPVTMPQASTVGTHATGAPKVTDSWNDGQSSDVGSDTSLGFHAARQLLVKRSAQAIDAPSVSQAPTVRDDTFAHTAINPVPMPQASAVRISIPQDPTVRDDAFAHTAIDPVTMPQATAVRTHAAVAPKVSDSWNDGLSSDVGSDTSLGFHAARQLLVKRSAQNGNPVGVMTKVQMRKNKFEKIRKNNLKGTGPEGLLKPSWEKESSVQYTKQFVSDIAPKKSFEELP